MVGKGEGNGEAERDGERRGMKEDGKGRIYRGKRGHTHESALVVSSVRKRST